MAFDFYLVPERGKFSEFELTSMRTHLEKLTRYLIEWETDVFVACGNDSTKHKLEQNQETVIPDYLSTLWLRRDCIVLGIVKGDTDEVLRQFARWCLARYECHLEEAAIGPVDIAALEVEE